MNPSPRFLADTHSLYWYLESSPRLSSKAAEIFADAEAGRAVLIVPHIVLAELYYLFKKYGRGTAFNPVLTNIAMTAFFQIEALVEEDLRMLPVVSDVPEMHDRLIAVQAKRLGVPVITADAELHSSAHIKSIW